MKNSITDNKENSIDNFNPNLDNNWLKSLKDTPFVFGTTKDNNECFTVYTSIDNAEQLEKEYNDTFLKAYPLTPDECFKKEDWLNNNKNILVITLPSNFISILKILKTNKEQYFTLYKSKWSLKEKTFDAIVVDSSMPYYLEFYNSIKKYIEYKVPTYLLEKETLKILK